MPPEVKTVIDELGRQYVLGKLLGKGYQGRVYAVQGQAFAVKLLNEPSPQKRELLANKLVRVRRLDLKGLPIARPMAVLRPPAVGYVMQLLTEMRPIREITEMPRGEASLTAWYLQTGGLVRRLRLLANAADVLSHLHSRGLVHADISPNNIFVSEDARQEGICLIDADNLCYESSAGMPTFFTPTYGAPELVLQKSGNNSLTDTHAFSVLAFQCLCQVHPLLGDWVADGEPELEVQALRGLLPWIDHPSDRRNRSSAGIPRQIVLSPRLQNLAGRAFGDGLTNRLDRPGVAEWADCLHRAADFTLKCAACAGSYYATASACPWCGTSRPSFVKITVGIWDPNREPGAEWKDMPPSGALTLTCDAPTLITRRVSMGSLDAAQREPAVELRLTATREIHVRSCDEQVYVLRAGTTGKEYPITRDWTRFPIKETSTRFILHFSEHVATQILPGRKPVHRYAVFSFSEGA